MGSSLRKPAHGVGIGLRHQHLPYVLEHLPDVPWFELLADNWMAEGGLHQDLLLQVAERYPIALHGVNLNLGGVDSLDWDYLRTIKQLMKTCNAIHYSEHACFSQYQQRYFHDLCPLPFTEEAVQHLAHRITRVQAFLGERILLENVSSYLSYQESEMTEAEFLTCIAHKSDCLLLLDINNVYVNAINHNLDADDFLATLPKQRIAEIHLAGHEEKDNFLLDTHSRPVAEPVWNLYSKAVSMFGQTPTLIEWDHDIPQWHLLEQERQKAEALSR
jgi:uncharacterized protein (UPF0276 family)